jgi:hypothetical protein
VVDDARVVGVFVVDRHGQHERFGHLASAVRLARTA